jgi:hypothetical protein
MALAISEYAMGIPKSAQEPMGKVELLLMQSNIRFSGLVDEFSEAMTQLVNNLIEMNVEFLTKDKSYRLLGTNEVEFKEFKKSDKKVKVDAKVEIEPKVEKLPEQRKAESITLYKMFVAEDKPDPGDAEAIKQWKIRKRTLQKLILEEFDKEEYEDLILGPEEKIEEKAPTTPPIEAPASPIIAPPIGGPTGTLPSPPSGPMAIPSTSAGRREWMAKIPLLNRILK